MHESPCWGCIKRHTTNPLIVTNIKLELKIVRCLVAVCDVSYHFYLEHGIGCVCWRQKCAMVIR